MKIELKGKINKIINKVKEDILNKGGIFEGNEIKGKFKIKGIKGKYNIENNIIDITILKKPFLISNNLIEKELIKYFTY